MQVIDIQKNTMDKSIQWKKELETKSNHWTKMHVFPIVAIGKPDRM
jgi:hypothetical protein